MATAHYVPLNLQSTAAFVKLCGCKFGWGDLSQDTVMDIGCGKNLYCSMSVLDYFPRVKSIIALDNNPAEFAGVVYPPPSIKRLLADIQSRTEILPYEGKIDKVISTHVLHQISDKESTFMNVYRLLKPEGEAAFLFTSDFGPYRVLKELSQMSKYKNYYKGSDVMDLYSGELSQHYYRETLAKIGFTVVEISEEEERFPRDLFVSFNDTLCQTISTVFSVPPELRLDIERTAIKVYHKLYADDDATSCYTATEMSIFLTKHSTSNAGFSSSC